MQHYLILDRDEVLNEMPAGMKYLKSPNDVVLKKENILGLQNLQPLKLKILVASNQRGIGLGLVTKEEVDAVNQEINRQLNKFNLQVEKFFYCPHKNLDNCNCRKPRPGMLREASNDFGFQLEDSIFGGDMTSDCYAGIRSGCKTILLNTHQPDQELSESKSFLGVFPSLLSASETIKEFYLNINC